MTWTSSDWNTTYNYLSCGLLLLTSITILFKKKGTIRFLLVLTVLLIFLSIWVNSKMRKVLIIEKWTSDSVNSAQYDSVHNGLRKANDSLLTLGNSITDIKTALAEKHLSWDSVNKTIINIGTQSKYNISNPQFKGKTYVGDNGNLH